MITLSGFNASYNTFILEISSIPVVVYNAIQSFVSAKKEVASIILICQSSQQDFNQQDILFKVLFLLLVKNN
jgi:hypothetical protein